MTHEPGSKAWAHRLVAEYEKGKPFRPTNVYRVAYQALGRTFPEGRCESQLAPFAPGTPPRKPASAVPVPRHAPLDDPWWETGARENVEPDAGQ